MTTQTSNPRESRGVVRRALILVVTVLGLVASGIGAAFVVESVMANSRRDGVSYVCLTPPTPHLTTALALPVDTNNPAVEVFAEIARRRLEA